MLRGKIISDGGDYSVKVGSVTVDVTDEVRSLIEQARAQARAASEQAIAELRAKHDDIVNRYNQIARIVLAGGAGMPTG
jgi:hypothetical protein